MADRFVKNPADIVKVQQKIKVTVLEVDLDRNRISLSMKSPADNSGTDVKKPRMKKPKTYVRKPKQKDNKKTVNNRNTSFNNPLAEALIKSGFK
jgi:uncharacterized protein